MFLKEVACQYGSKDGKTGTRGQNLKAREVIFMNAAGWEGDTWEGALGSTCPESREQRPSAPANCCHVGMWPWYCHSLVKRIQPPGFLCEIFLI